MKHRLTSGRGLWLLPIADPFRLPGRVRIPRSLGLEIWGSDLSTQLKAVLMRAFAHASVQLSAATEARVSRNASNSSEHLLPRNNKATKLSGQTQEIEFKNYGRPIRLSKRQDNKRPAHDGIKRRGIGGCEVQR